MHRKAGAILALSLLSAAPDFPYDINYTLASPGRVSVNVYDQQGHVVRELLHADSQTAGKHMVTWDGKDRSGAAVADPQACAWKLLATPDGLHSELVARLGSDYPLGTRLWDYGLGNHTAPSCVGVDSDGVIIGAAGAEQVRSALRMSLDGRKHIWSSAGMPAIDVGVMDGYAYYLQCDFNLRDRPTLVKWKATDPIPDNGDPGRNYDWDIRATPSKSWDSAQEILHCAAYRGQLVVSYTDQNRIRWINPANGALIDSATVPAPKGVAIDGAGDVLVVTRGAIQRLSRANKALAVVVDSAQLDSPFRLDVDRSSGEMVVAEDDKGAGRQVKRFSATGALLKTYGRKGGRQDGLYQAGDFASLRDIAADNQGGFFVAEQGVPRRVAHMDRDGQVIKAWYGGEPWSPFGAPEPGNPGTVWLSSNYGALTRITVDYATGAWTVHSNYRFLNLAGGLFGALQSQGTGINVWWPIRRNGVLYLVFDGDMAVMRVDERNWKLVPCMRGEFSTGVGGAQQAYLWTDGNGDGLPQESEIRRYNWGMWSWQRAGLRADTGFTYTCLNYSDSKLLRIGVAKWVNDAPVYQDLPDAYARPFSALPADCVKPDGVTGNVYQSSHWFATDARDRSLYGAFGIGDHGWGVVDDCRLVKWDSTGKVAWEAASGGTTAYAWRSGFPTSPLTPPAAGKVGCFKNNAGVVHGCVVATDFDGGWDVQPGITYCWNGDGLWVGRLFDTYRAGDPYYYYQLSGEFGAGAVQEDPKTGDVLAYFGSEDETRVYRVTGWNGWTHGVGRIGAAAPDSLWTDRIANAIQPPQAGGAHRIGERMVRLGGLRIAVPEDATAVTVYNPMGERVVSLDLAGSREPIGMGRVPIARGVYWVRTTGKSGHALVRAVRMP